MGKSLLEIIAEKERKRLKTKNIKYPTDDIEKASISGINTYGRFIGEYLNVKNNVESVSLNEVGDIALNDLKNLNIFPKDVYDRIRFDYNDVGVIDMPEIELISENIYQKNSFLNKYSSVDYKSYNVNTPVGNPNKSESYIEYIKSIQEKIRIQSPNLIDIFLNQLDIDDTPLGEIGYVALRNAKSLQLATNVKRATVGRINNQPYSLIKTGNLIKADYDITVPSTGLGKAAEFLLEMQGINLPFSYLPEDVFNFNKDISYEKRIELLLKYTGKGQITQLRNLIIQNKYKGLLVAPDFTIEEELYVKTNLKSINPINTDDLVVKRGQDLNEGRVGRYQELFGIESTHKDTNNPDKFSDRSHFTWARDVDIDFIEWKKEGDNRFNPKSLLYKTKELVATQNAKAFLDMGDKEFLEIKNGESRIISRGDATTASGSWNFTNEDDDFTTGDGTTGLHVNEGDFFRVWTKSVGYTKLNRTLRHRGLDNNDTRSVLMDNGLINHAPTTRNKLSGTDEFVIKRYMFSLENLAWNDNLADLPECEHGVGDAITGHRGRIMWFPPYNLKIEENVSVDWNETKFIGRGEKVYTYNNTSREATLNFSIIVDHPDIVNRQEKKGRNIEFWERYFKGDKIVEDTARRLLRTNLTRQEQEEVEKYRFAVTPDKKKVDDVKITPEKKEEEDNEEVKKSEDDGGLGNKVLSAYFANEVTALPKPYVDVRTDFNVNSGNVEDTIRKASISDLKNNNAGYEDGGFIDNIIELFPELDSKLRINGVKVRTANGLRYSGNGFNGEPYTYLNGNQIKPENIRKTNDNGEKCPNGYTDRNNYGLNESFYDEWSIIEYNYLESKRHTSLENELRIEEGKYAKKANITIVGNASGAVVGRSPNSRLARQRAESIQSWFKNKYIPYLRAIGVNTVFGEIVAIAKSDEEDKQKKDEKNNLLSEASNAGDDRRAFLTEQANSVEFCEECNQPDERPCKETRRVDIFVKILDAEEEEDEPTPKKDVSIDDVENTDDYTPEEDKQNQDPEDEVPELDPSILSKLIYTECDFFEFLEVEQPLLYQTISERIKYFHPAFHSITPQGFNSRLTFLHQCTRQSDSIGRDGIDNTVNLAFGRPPVLIMRIGDFYHTRIIVKSMSISYADDMTWDLNPEGIGVQPMYADISMQIVILGGESMSSPINRLQNALSFNFYANTEQYDDRADSVVFNEGIGFDEDTNQIKTGQILDGIKLSKIVGADQSYVNKNIAIIRKQSRIALDNQVGNTPPDTVPAEYNDVGDLIDLKRRLNMPLSEDEKVTIKANDRKIQFDQINVNNNLSTEEIIPITLKQTLEEQENANLNKLMIEYVNNGKIESDEIIVRDVFKQYVETVSNDPENLPSGYADEQFDEYIKEFDVEDPNAIFTPIISSQKIN